MSKFNYDWLVNKSVALDGKEDEVKDLKIQVKVHHFAMLKASRKRKPRAYHISSKKYSAACLALLVLVDLKS